MTAAGPKGGSIYRLRLGGLGVSDLGIPGFREVQGPSSRFRDSKYLHRNPLRDDGLGL